MARSTKISTPSLGNDSNDSGSDAGVDAFICERLGGAPDHPMTVAFPEGEYLKGLILVQRESGSKQPPAQ